jgi:signal transduction histidine kinase
MDDPRVSILLVDDQASRLLSYEAILAPLGERLVFARSGREALQQLIREDFAAIVLDVNMPGMDGFETASMIHQHPRHERTPIIFVTAVHVTDLDQLRGYELGAVDYVYVPVVPQILRTKVQVLSELYRQRRELERLNRQLADANDDLARANTSLQAEKARELELLNADLARANAELGDANAALALEVQERRQAEAALQEADRRKDEFLATLAHELRNPLAPLRSALEVLSRRPDDAIVEQMRGMMQRQVKHMVRLVDDLLDVSRISRNVLELRREWVDLGAVVDVAVETAGPLIERAGHRLTVDVPDRDARIWVDAARLAQVMANLLNNAAKYTPAGGAIGMRAAVEADGLVVSVRDSGHGIAPDLQARIFDLFVQGEARKESRDGLGIGLTLVKRLVELHGGRVSVRSEGRDRGSEFRVEVPVAQSVDASVAPATLAPRRHVGGLRALVVDDNRDAAIALARFLETEGVAVSVAHSGRDAVSRARLERPSIVILDLGMPDVDGYEAARLIRADVEPVPLLVAVSGWGREDDRRLSRDAGFDHHLVKPADGAEVLQLIDGVRRGADGTRAVDAAPPAADAPAAGRLAI